ncbi:hypothetical protein [Rhizobacter sp. Root404]|uniref:hypothetical protein n=1 Tax=Rhizobacter sp. Root404 TaxID=1736528 RepID=UPI000701C7C4|nr:hypothetical protein [Rhizobacter sp. Root404]KQW40277.1 hypothetical protein ASC76_02200 [Rhizobacter sp. Root404]
MQPYKATLHRVTCVSAAAALLLAGASVARADEPSPWYLGVSQGFTHDSNVYRFDGSPSDNYSTTSLLGGFDQQISRQRVHANARVGYNKYQNETRLNNTSYALSGGWDWATLEKLSGSFNVSASQSLAQFNGNQILQIDGALLPPANEKNVLKAEQFSADIRWGGDGLLSLFGNYSHGRSRYSGYQSLVSNATTDSGSVGFNYRIGGLTTVGMALRTTRTDLPFGIAPFIPVGTPPQQVLATLQNKDLYGPDRSTSNNLDLLADWRYSAQTSVKARLSYSRVTYDNSNRDFSGLTGALDATYAPTAKLAFNASISRDAGSNTTSATYFDPATGQQNTFQTGSNQTSDTLVFGANYAATAKTNFYANTTYRRGNNNNSSSSDHFRTASIGVNYVPARAWQLGCNLAHEARSAGAYSYDANVIGCNAQFTLR